jgi:hypothetical protein
VHQYCFANKKVTAILGNPNETFLFMENLAIFVDKIIIKDYTFIGD